MAGTRAGTRVVVKWTSGKRLAAEKASSGKKAVVKETGTPRTGRFAAIDFETADYGRDSACALSVVVAENDEIVKQEHFLIRPPRRDFFFSYLHGITWSHVAKKPVFEDLWPEVAPLFEEVDFVAAHNASFDRSVLHACCENAGIEPPLVDYVCTVKLARHAWDLYPTTLPDVCRKFRIPLKHHDALCDATACAKIVLEALRAGINPMVVVDRKKAKRAG